MALLWRDPFDSYSPARYFNRNFFDWDPEEFLSPAIPREVRNWLRESPRLPSSFGDFDTGAQVSFDKDKFNANIDVQQFKPNEISVKVTDDNTITVEGKHEERPDEHGYISRQFVRRYVLPKDHDISKVESKLSSDGVLTITAPKTGDPNASHRQIPIMHTGQPSRSIEDKSKGKK